VLVPIAVALIVKNGLTPTAVLLSAGLDWVAKVFPHPIIRGIQLSVGLLFCQLAWRLVSATPKAFADHKHSVWLLAGFTLVVIAAALIFRHREITLLLVLVAVVAMVLTLQGPVTFGPSVVHTPHLSRAAFAAAAVALVLPQVPLSFANSCLATADTARTYFGAAAHLVRPGRLAITIGLANLFGGGIGGVPVCHGAGGGVVIALALSWGRR
jgi:SulP family sulfate permease